jgi:hypothetical protein
MLAVMSDVSRHLPLSNRERVDEDGVTGDWRAEVAEVVVLAAAFATTDAERAAFLDDARLSADPTASLAELAEGIRSGGRRRIRALVDATRALLLASDGAPIDVSTRISGAVGLYAVTRMSFDRRAAVAGTALVATDAGWSLGRGASRPAPALDILRFVLGLDDRLPPVAAPTDGRKL